VQQGLATGSPATPQYQQTFDPARRPGLPVVTVSGYAE
jgi:hypothetical protein